ncbi:type II toxin-antitoxin system HicB family antitoxin [bacterium]|nr:type II toxin-antitoxin system HicB family antitoxin [bacterium]
MTERLIELHIEKLPEGAYLATCDALPGLIAQGRTLAETLEIAQDVARKLIEARIEHGDDLPERLRGQLPNEFDLAISVAA